MGTRLAMHIAGMLLLAIAVTVALWLWMGRPMTSGPYSNRDALDAMKVVLAIAGGLGGVVFLTVAYRRQRTDPVPGVAWHDCRFDFSGAVIDGGNLHRITIPPGCIVNFNAAVFRDGTVNFKGARFRGGTVNFFRARFCGGTVNVKRPRAQAVPPVFDDFPDGVPAGLHLYE